MSAVLTQKEFDQAKAEGFAESLLQTLNNGAACLMISIGHRTGLFDKMRGMRPATSEEIAASALLHERYVREWLGAMVTAGIIDIDAETGKYRLPNEHAAFLTRPAGADNLAVFAQYIPLLGGVEDGIIESFKNGGGVPYSEFPRFHEVMAEDGGQSVLSSLESHIIPLIPGLHEKLQSGIKMLDVGCGRARVMTKLAELYPKSEFIGLDLSEEAIGYARDEAAKRGLTNIRFEARDLSDFDQVAEPEAYDFITTFDAVHDQAKPLNILKGINRALKPDGIYLMQDIKGSSHHHGDIEHPIGPLLYTISTMHCMTVSLAQGGEGLGAMWGEEKTREYLEKAGFASVEKNELAHDIQNNWYVVKKGASVSLKTGVNLSYVESGDPQGPPVILLHGYGDSHFSYSRIVEGLGKKYRVLALDQRGHGNSSKPETGYLFADFASDVVAFMDALGIEKATLIGHSMGSIVSQGVAVNYPERVERVVLLGTMPTVNTDGVAELVETVATLEDPVPVEFITEFQNSTVHIPVPEGFMARVISESGKLPAYVWRECMTGMLAADYKDELNRITAPTLIIWGENDPFFPALADQEFIQSSIEGSELRVYQETGHCPHWERPEKVLADIEDFLGK